MTRFRPGGYLPAGAAARGRGVSTRALCRYALEEKLARMRSPGGRRSFRGGDLDALISQGAGSGPAVGYARVSSRRQQTEGGLDRQVSRLREAGGSGMTVFNEGAA